MHAVSLAAFKTRLSCPLFFQVFLLVVFRDWREVCIDYIEMASALLGPLCQQLANPISEEYKLVSNVKEEINKLRFTVSLISGVLQDAEEKQVKEKAVGIWLRSLRQVLYDADDVLDEVSTDAALQTAEVTDNSSPIAMIAKVCDLICSSDCIHQFLSIRNIAHQIKEIRLRLDDLSKEKDTLGLRVLGGSSYPEASRSPRRLDTSSLLPDASCVIGRDVEKEWIIQTLLGSSESGRNNNIAVITIVGMGGLGKTTLAKAVFNDPRVKQYFQPMMWVCVSDDFDERRITRNIIDELSTSHQTRDLCDNPTWNTLQNRLKEKVEGKRFLLVLDDVWEHNHRSKWESLCDPLRYGGKQSKIIVTTRDRKVSEMVKGIPIFLTGLSSENLWSIFEKYAFDGCNPHKRMQLENMGKEIVEKLKGSPLAAKTIGKLLNTSLDVSYWKRIIKDKLNLLPKDANGITPILKLSYDHLPGQLKQCFAYCSLFPKDYKFKKNELVRLVRLWMAQSILQTRMGHLTENVGSEYFDDLLYKSFFEQNGRYGFMMHDLIHDLAESVSEDDCFRLEDNNHRSPSETVRHISLHTKDFDLVKLKELCKHGKLRSLLFFRGCTFGLAPHLDNLFMMLKRLRALRLSHCDIKELPESIGFLKHLRLLDISGKPMSKLPESLCNLHNLEVLDLQGCTRLVSLPSNMSALINLRHLDANCELVCSIQGLGKLTALQELAVRGRILKEVANMGMLRQLRIHALEEVPSKEEAIQARLGDKEHLDVLELEWSDYRAIDQINPRLEAEVLEAMQPVDSITQMVIRYYAGVRYPRWLDDRSWVLSCSLERLELDNCENWEVLPPLGQLRCLKRLTISGIEKVRGIGPEFLGCSTADVGGTDKLVQGGFPSLERLKFKDMPEWEEWDLHGANELDDQGPQQQQPSLFPRLRELAIFHCPKLRQLPPLPPTLTELFIFDVGLTSLPAGWLPSSSSSSKSPSLSDLSIQSCPNLVCSGPLVAVTEELTISECPKLLYLEAEAATATYSSSPSSTSSLTSSPPLSPPASCVMAVRLNTLCIERSSPQQIKVWLLHYPSLQRLEIAYCPDLTGFDGDAGGDHIGRELEVALLNLAPSLRILKFLTCKNLVSLPTKLRCLSSLQDLQILDCPQIKCLPAAGLPESLESLSIKQCPALKERCHVEEGGPESDWPLVSRIPRLTVG